MEHTKRVNMTLGAILLRGSANIREALERPLQRAVKAAEEVEYEKKELHCLSCSYAGNVIAGRLRIRYIVLD